jgi:hypothetical protein
LAILSIRRARHLYKLLSRIITQDDENAITRFLYTNAEFSYGSSRERQRIVLFPPLKSIQDNVPLIGLQYPATGPGRLSIPLLGRRGTSLRRARDHTQEFFARLIEKKYLAGSGTRERPSRCCQGELTESNARARFVRNS